MKTFIILLAITITIVSNSVAQSRGPGDALKAQQICMATVDTSQNLNLIMWNKIDGLNIDYYRIYKDLEKNGEYVAIGEVPFDDKPLFYDQNSSPHIQSAIYKITYVDVMGEEANINLSIAHETLFLQIKENVEGNGFDISWNRIDGAGFDLTGYSLYRGMDGGAFEQLSDFGSTISTYTDQGIINTAVTYMLAANKPGEACNPYGLKRAMTGPFTQSLSNIDEYIIVGKNNISNNSAIKVYPNPAKENAVIDIANKKYSQIILMDVCGNIIQTIEPNNSNIQVDCTKLATGMYFIEFIGAKRELRKLVVQ